jgi:hypothetical protein
MDKIYFQGTRNVISIQKKKKKNKSVSCTDFLKEKFMKKVGTFNTIMYDQKISVQTIKGVMYGPHSISFKQYMRM